MLIESENKYITKHGEITTNCLLIGVSCSRNHHLNNFSYMMVLQINSH